MADLQPYRFKPERVTNREDGEKQKSIGVLVSDVKSCQLKENVFVTENSQRQKTKWKVEFYAYTALLAVNGKTTFFVNCFRYKKVIN